MINELAVVVVLSLFSYAYRHLRDLYAVKEEKKFDLLGKLRKLKRIRNLSEESSDGDKKIGEFIQQKKVFHDNRQCKGIRGIKVTALRAKFEQKPTPFVTNINRNALSNLREKKELEMGQKSIESTLSAMDEMSEIQLLRIRATETDIVALDHFDDSDDAVHSRNYHTEIRQTESITRIVDMLQANKVWTESPKHLRIYLLLNGYDYDTIFEVLQWKQIMKFAQ